MKLIDALLLSVAAASIAVAAGFAARAAALYDSSGVAIGTSANPLVVQGAAAAGATTGFPAPTPIAGYTTVTAGVGSGSLNAASVSVTGAVQTSLSASGTGNTFQNGGFTDGLTNTISSYRFVTNDQLFNGTTWDRARGDVNGAVVQTWAMSGSRWSFAVATSGIANTTTAVTIKAAAGASVKTYLTSCQIDHDTLGGVTELVWRDGAGGTVLARKKLQVTAVEGAQVTFASPLAGTANTLMEVATLTAVTGGVYVNCQGFTGA